MGSEGTNNSPISLPSVEPITSAEYTDPKTFGAVLISKPLYVTN